MSIISTLVSVSFSYSETNILSPSESEFLTFFNVITEFSNPFIS